jgi:Ca2+-binding EF-hand superfamily protein
LYFASAHAADKPIKTFICAGQSNMVGWGDSTKLHDDLRKGNNRVLMFEDGRWQPLRPHSPANQGQRRVGLTEFHFGPEIAFGHEMAKAWPDETIGIIKFAIGGTTVLAWKPDWSREDVDRVGQGRHGSLYKTLMAKIDRASKARDIEIVGFLWLQGGGDMKKVDVAKEYLGNLKSLVVAVRKAAGVANLPFIYGSSRRAGIPDDLSDLEPEVMDGRYPAAQWVLKAQFDAQKAIPDSKMVILRDIEKHPRNVHYNTAGQLEVGKLFAEAFLEDSQVGVRLAPPNCPACTMGLTAEFVFKRLDSDEDRTVTVREFRKSPGVEGKSTAGEAVGRIDEDGDGKLSWQEFEAAYRARHANCKPSKPVGGLRPDGRGNATMFARVFMMRNDKNGDGKVDRSEFRGAQMGFDRLDQSENGFIEADELGELHQSRFNDPRSMRERLQSGDVREPPRDKRPKGSSHNLDAADK